MSTFVYVAIFLIISVCYKNKLTASILFGLFFGLAYQIGHADYISYTNLYDGFADSNGLGLTAAVLTGHYEPLYILALIISTFFDLNYYIFRFFMYTFAYYFFMLAVDRSGIKDKASFILLFLSLTGFSHLFSIDRQTISILLTVAAIYSAKGLIKVFPIGFHLSSGLIVAPLLLSKNRKALIFSAILFALILAFYFDKYLYLLSDVIDGSTSITNIIICVALAVELILFRNTINNESSNIRLLLAVCLVVGLVTLSTGAIFYRLKALFILIILISYFSRPRKVIFSRNVRFGFVLVLSYLISLFYVLSDPLAFDGYQNVMTLPLLEYKDKTELWWEIFRD